jgi:mono/diheme cytochrome c family protein
MTQLRPGLRYITIMSVVTSALLWVNQGDGLAQQEEVAAVGGTLFQQNCATCHGPKAKGDGPVANLLTTKPADLTQLTKKNNGEFPFWRVYRIIDGREEVPGHGEREMPVWGSEFLIKSGSSPLGYGSSAMNEAAVRGQILGLVYYLQSIQEQ